MQTFRMIVIMAKNNGWIFTDPFVNYKIRLKRVDRGYLADAELQKNNEEEVSHETIGTGAGCFHFFMFYGLGVY